MPERPEGCFAQKVPDPPPVAIGCIRPEGQRREGLLSCNTSTKRKRVSPRQPHLLTRWRVVLVSWSQALFKCFTALPEGAVISKCYPSHNPSAKPLNQPPLAVERIQSALVQHPSPKVRFALYEADLRASSQASPLLSPAVVRYLTRMKHPG